MTDLPRTPALVAEYCDELYRSIPEDFREEAQAVAKRAELKHPINRAPATVAAASVYLIGLLRKPVFSQQEVSDASGVSAVAIRQAYPEIGDAEDIEMMNMPGSAPTPVRRHDRTRPEVDR